MPFFQSFGRAWTAAILFIAVANAQQCYYPDGTKSSDTPCSDGGDSSCCASTAFCLDNGLCFGGGVVSRGSCTDKTWGSDQCTAYCRTEAPSQEIAITPCPSSDGDSTFVCGMNSSQCQDTNISFQMAGTGTLLLRASQVSALVAPILSSYEAQVSGTNIPTSCPATGPTTTGFTTAALAGLGIGLGVPLLMSICAVLFLWNKERSRQPKLMYQLPETDEFKFSPPPPFASRPILARHGSSSSDVGSFRTVSPSVYKGNTPVHMQSFAERYSAMNKSPTSIRAELEGQPVGSAFRFEVGSGTRPSLSSVERPRIVDATQRTVR